MWRKDQIHEENIKKMFFFSNFFKSSNLSSKTKKKNTPSDIRWKRVNFFLEKIEHKTWFLAEKIKEKKRGSKWKYEKLLVFTWGYSGWILLTNSVAIETCRKREREMPPQRDGQRVRTVSASKAQWIICYYTTKEI